MTINQLKKLVDEQIKKGNGDRKIYLSDDDEGNGYHALYYAFTEISEEKDLTNWEKMTKEKVTDIKEFMEETYPGIDYEEMGKIIILG